MTTTRLETFSEALDELHESLEAHLDEAAGLLHVVEDAEFLVGTQKARLEKIARLIESTLAFRQLIGERLEELRDLRSQMKALLPPKQ